MDHGGNGDHVRVAITRNFRVKIMLVQRRPPCDTSFSINEESNCSVSSLGCLREMTEICGDSPHHSLNLSLEMTNDEVTLCDISGATEGGIHRCAEKRFPNVCAVQDPGLLKQAHV